MTSHPRVQRRRVPGWRKPEGAVIVDRTSRWGNPFTVASVIESGLTDNEGDARRLVATRFRSWLLGLTPNDPDVYRVGRRDLDRRWMREHLHELRGKALCCPCPTGQACHADELSALADAPDRETGGPGGPDRVDRTSPADRVDQGGPDRSGWSGDCENTRL